MVTEPSLHTRGDSAPNRKRGFDQHGSITIPLPEMRTHSASLLHTRTSALCGYPCSLVDQRVGSSSKACVRPPAEGHPLQDAVP